MRQRIGYVIQEGGLFPHLTARENAAIMPRYLRWESARTAKRVEQLTELTRLTSSLLDRYPCQLSGGQRQRVSLIRALMLDPDVLLLDEPLGDLDPMVRAELQDDLRNIFRELGKTVVLVTHDLAEAGYLGDRVTLIRSGRIVQQGSFAEDNPADDFVARFVQAQRI
jgi:osmoprotectant transport system ATP-binding protein